VLLLPGEADIKAAPLSPRAVMAGSCLSSPVGHNLLWKVVIGTLVGIQRVRMVLDPWWVAVCSGQRSGVTCLFRFCPTL
jgi:hypothetical protein